MSRQRLSIVSLLIAFFTVRAQAIIYIVPNDRELVKSARAVVIGTAMASHSELNASGGIVTVADFQVEQILKGAIADDVIRIVEPGGFLSEHAMLIPGSPRYEQGAQYLVLLDQWSDGAWRTNGWQLGQFAMTTDLHGEKYFSRGGDEMIFGLAARDGSQYIDHFRNADAFVRFVQTLAKDSSAPASEEYVVDRADVILARHALQPERKLVIAPNSTRPDYLLSGNFRWQSGPGASWGYCCPSNYPAQFNGPAAASSAVVAWNGNGTSIAYVMGGETPTKNGGLSTPDNANTILFNDPSNLIGSSGAFAVGGISSALGTYMLADGFTYNNTREVDVVVTQNSKIPGFVNQQLAASLLTHEVGHTLGFRHSDQTANSSGPCVAPSPCAGVGSAVMAHQINSPGLTLQQWDRDAEQTVYGSGPVCAPPSISSGPTASPSMINSGQSSTLSVVAGGSSPFTYQWYQGSPGNTGTPLGTTSSIVVSPTSTTTYWMRVTGQCSPTADSGGVTVTVSCTPVITGQPSDQQVTSGGTVPLSVAFTSATPVTVTWYRGFAGDTSQQIGTGQNITSPAITTTTSFWARLTNTCGNTDTRTATISIAASCVPPNTATAFATTTSIMAGQQVGLEVGVNGTSPLSFQWFRGIAPDQSSPISGATTFSITDTPSSSTNYWVKVTNTCGSTNSSTVAVTVTGTPQCTGANITMHPQSVTILSGMTATLTVAATGTNLHYAWFQGTTGQTGTPVGSDSATFTTPALSKDTSYWVHVTNDCADASSTTAVVTVKPARKRTAHH